MPKRKTPVMPEGLHPIAEYRFKHEFTQAELSSLLQCDRSILAAIEEGVIQQKNRGNVLG